MVITCTENGPNLSKVYLNSLLSSEQISELLNPYFHGKHKNTPELFFTWMGVTMQSDKIWLWDWVI